jgi:hypothetical protein
MSAVRFIAMPTHQAEHYWSGGPDANGQPPERHTSPGGSMPCRHCLTEIAEGVPYLILAHRPFPEPQPYAEIGPIFLHAEPCRQHPVSAETPDMFLGWERLLLKGYGSNDRIVYGTGTVVPTQDVDRVAAVILSRADVAYVHARSAKNNCYQVRIERA